MKESPSLIFSLLAVAVTVVIGGELRSLLAQRSGNAFVEKQNRLGAEANRARHKDVQELQANQEVIADSISKITNGITSEPPAPGSFQPLQQLGITVEFHAKESLDLWRYEFGPSQIEFHRFLPALNALEVQYPLLRIARLELSLAGGPFQTSATAIQIRGEFELIRSKVHPLPSLAPSITPAHLIP